MIPLRDANPTRTRPVVTIALIAACVALWVLEISLGSRDLDRFLAEWALVPATLSRALAGDQADHLYRAVFSLVSSQFLHDPSNPLHLGFNMLFLWIFGNNIEDRLGHLGFLTFYLVAGILAGLAQFLVAPDFPGPVIGASGAIAAVLGAYLVLYPRAKVLSLVYFGLFFQLIQIPAVVLLGLWFAIQVVGAVMASGADASGGGVALFAHIGGFVAGIVIGLLVRSVAGRGPALRSRPTDRAGVG